MMAWIIRFLGGFIPGQKPFGEWLGKILWVVGIVLFMSLATNIWEKFFPPKPNIVNVAGDYIQEKKDVISLGCTMWRGYVKMGIRQ